MVLVFLVKTARFVGLVSSLLQSSERAIAVWMCAPGKGVQKHRIVQMYQSAGDQIAP